MKRDYIDFNEIEAKHADIHARLENWARSCAGGFDGAGSGRSPMFRLYRSHEHWEGQEANIPIDYADATKIAKGVRFLPDPHAFAIRWFYVKPTPHRIACQALGVNKAGLQLYVRDGRQMLVNRRV